MNIVKFAFLGLALTGGLLMSGCSKQEKTAGGIIVGAGTGAAIGAAVGNGPGAAVGAGVGGVLGGVIGHNVN